MICCCIHVTPFEYKENASCAIVYACNHVNRMRHLCFAGGEPDDSGLGDDFDGCNPDDLLYPLQKLEKYMDSENIFSR